MTKPIHLTELQLAIILAALQAWDVEEHADIRRHTMRKIAHALERMKGTNDNR
tara:strand:+ start:284 stop:442 length:159 start_codon:yes stop_codon:yes gene_type:complete